MNNPSTGIGITRTTYTDPFGNLAVWPPIIDIRIKKLHEAARLPHTWSEHAVGLDLHALVLNETGRPHTAIIPPNTSRLIRTGLAAECAPGYFLMVCSRSGLARRSLFVTNSPGLIDPDYRGEIQVLLYNGGHETYYVRHEERIAQLVLFPYLAGKVVQVDELSKTERGESGLGSTGD